MGLLARGLAGAPGRPGRAAVGVSVEAGRRGQVWGGASRGVPGSTVDKQRGQNSLVWPVGSALWCKV